MLGSRRVLGIIAARGGSKGLPGKNIRPLGGKPLIAWSVDAAHDSALLDRTIVSTDDPDIAAAARDCGADVPFLRPPSLATDDASIIDAVLHAVDSAGPGFDIVVLLQATSPLRLGQDIDTCLTMMDSHRAKAVCSVTVPAKSPYWMFRIDSAGRVHPLLPSPDLGSQRQQLEPSFVANGAVFAADIAWLRQERRFWMPGETVAYVMPPERSVDIDTMLDFQMAEILVGQNHGDAAAARRN